MTELAVRRATEADVGAMAAIVHEWEVATDWMEARHSAEDLAGVITEAFPKREIWVAGVPVDGYLSFDPETARVGGLYCRTTGQGQGRALMDRAKAGRDFVWLHTHVPNDAAQRFYRREGFVEVSRHAPTPPDTVPELRMEWRR